MQEVTIDLATAEPGEICSLLQLRLPDAPGGDASALLDKINRFVSLYLPAAQPSEARFAQMESLTWMIAAPEGADSDLEAVRADLADTLFGADDGQLVQLETPDRVEARSAEPGDEARPEDEVWLEADTAGDEAGASEFEGQDILIVDAESEHQPTESFDIEADSIEAAFEGPDAALDPDADWEIGGATAARRAAFDDESDVFEVDALDIEIVDGTPPAAPAERLPGEVELDASVPDTLVEAPERSAPADIASELESFRAEMREIASSIPAADGGDALAAFRSELDAIAGSMGQRVDGAAQRIEAAAERISEVGGQLDGARLDDAAARAEQCADRLEKGVEQALDALAAATKAMQVETLGPTNGAAGEVG